MKAAGGVREKPASEAERARIPSGARESEADDRVSPPQFFGGRTYGVPAPRWAV